MQNIHCILKVQDPVLIERAESFKIPVQLELGFTDLFSLEPVDDQYRPIRHKEKTFKEWVEDRKVSSRENKGLEIQDIPLADLDLENLENKENDEENIMNEQEIAETALYLPSATNKKSVIQTIFQHDKLNHQ